MVDRGDLHGQTLNDAITCDCTHACMEGPAGAGGALSACACACVKYVCARRKQWLVLCPIKKKMSGTSGKIISMK